VADADAEAEAEAGAEPEAEADAEAQPDAETQPEPEAGAKESEAKESEAEVVDCGIPPFSVEPDGSVVISEIRFDPSKATTYWYESVGYYYDTDTAASSLHPLEQTTTREDLPDLPGLEAIEDSPILAKDVAWTPAKASPETPAEMPETPTKICEETKDNVPMIPNFPCMEQQIEEVLPLPSTYCPPAAASNAITRNKLPSKRKRLGSTKVMKTECAVPHTPPPRRSERLPNLPRRSERLPKKRMRFGDD
jgi:hypothetical protein